VKEDLRATRREMALARARGAEDREFQELCRDLEARDPSPAEPERG